MHSFFTIALWMTPRSSEADIIDWIVKIGAGVIFVGIPLIKGILQAREKSKEESPKDERRSSREKEIEGRRAFEELMRGGTTLMPPPVPMAPPQVLARTESGPPRATESSLRGAQRTIAPKPLTEREEISAQPLSGSEFEAEEGAQDEAVSELAERREQDEMRRQEAELRVPEEIAREEYAASSALRENVAPVPVEVFRAPALEVASASTEPEVASRLLGKRAGTDRRAALRRALVLNEVLGRPVAMRDGSDTSTPAGLRG